MARGLTGCYWRFIVFSLNDHTKINILFVEIGRCLAQVDNNHF